MRLTYEGMGLLKRFLTRLYLTEQLLNINALKQTFKIDKLNYPGTR